MEGNLDYGDETYNFNQSLPYQTDTIYREPNVGLTRLAEDSITGRDENDILLGERGVDVIMSDAGDDYLFGGADADNLEGGLGTNVVHSRNPSSTDLTATKLAIDAALVNLFTPTLQRYVNEISVSSTVALEGQLDINS